MASYGGIQLPKPKPMTMRFHKGQLVPNASSFKPTPFYAPTASSNATTTRLRNMGSSTRKLSIAPTHIRARRRRNTRRRSRSRRA